MTTDELREALKARIDGGERPGSLAIEITPEMLLEILDNWAWPGVEVAGGSFYVKDGREYLEPLLSRTDVRGGGG